MRNRIFIAIALAATTSIVLASGFSSPAPSATTALDTIGAVRGSVLYRGVSAWSALTPGTAGNVLTSNGAGADPTYQTAPASTWATVLATGNTTGATNPLISSGQRINFEGTTSSFPALRNNSDVLEVRKADNTGYNGISANHFRVFDDVPQEHALLNITGLVLKSTGYFQWSNDPVAVTTHDTSLERASAGIIRVGTGDSFVGLGAIEVGNLLIVKGRHGANSLLASDAQLQFNSTTSLATGSADAGISRHAAGITKSTNGGATLSKHLVSALNLNGTAAGDVLLKRDSATDSLQVRSGNDSGYTTVFATAFTAKNGSDQTTARVSLGGFQANSTGTFSFTDASVDGTQDTSFERDAPAVARVGIGAGVNTGSLRQRYEVELDATSTVGSPNILTDLESNKTFENSGATVKVGFQLPDASSGATFTFINLDADGLRVTSVGDDIIRSGTLVTSVAGYIETTTIGAVITLRAVNGTTWIAISAVESWTTGP